jgi:hypothetical protein
MVIMQKCDCCALMIFNDPPLELLCGFEKASPLTKIVEHQLTAYRRRIELFQNQPTETGFRDVFGQTYFFNYGGQFALHA